MSKWYIGSYMCLLILLFWLVDCFSDGRVSSQTREVLKRLLALKPESRFTAKQLLYTIQDLVAQW